MNEPWPELAVAIRQALVDIEFAHIALKESERTLIVPPRDLDRARWIVEQAGAERVITVTASPFLPDGGWWLLDENALEASLRNRT